MTNAQMIANRFARFHRARRMVAFIVSNLEAGRGVQINTATRAVRYTKKAHATMFKATKSGAYVQRGKSWDCIDYTCVQSYNL